MTLILIIVQISPPHPSGENGTKTETKTKTESGNRETIPTSRLVRQNLNGLLGPMIVSVFYVYCITLRFRHQ